MPTATTWSAPNHAASSSSFECLQGSPPLHQSRPRVRSWLLLHRPRQCQGSLIPPGHEAWGTCRDHPAGHKGPTGSTLQVSDAQPSTCAEAGRSQRTAVQGVQTACNGRNPVQVATSHQLKGAAPWCMPHSAHRACVKQVQQQSCWPAHLGCVDLVVLTNGQG